MSAPPYEEKPTSGVDSGQGMHPGVNHAGTRCVVPQGYRVRSFKVLIGKAENAVRDLIQEYAKHNPGRGVEIIFLNSNHGRKNIQTAREVTELFQKEKPWGGTPIWRKLQQILPYQHWWSRLLPQEEDFILIVISDGASDHPKRVEKAIIRAAKGRLEGKSLMKALLGAAWGFLDRKGTAGETLEGAGQ
ncbi:hypothetical protein B0H14DRAFT_3675877 [Mycena olivaceomarginata]|nr:hypothetical protein B0H14DRAFT_3675877 [Mycena olivaceomarginata]